jgi:cytochrome c oxidase cbb3-type subunit I/II
MSTLEGPILSIKSVSALAHYTDWIVAHVHGGTLGWNGFMAAGMFYWLVPRLYGTTLHSTRAANAHFWIALTGIALYMFAMWIAGVSQGLMWRAQTSDGALQYPNFLETLKSIVPLYHVRLVGGSLYFVGMVIMVWNLWATARKGRAVDGRAVVVVETRVASGVSTWSLVMRPAFLLVIAAVLVTLTLGWASPVQSAMAILALVAIAEFAFILLRRAREDDQPRWHAFLEGRPLFFTVLLLGAVMVGGVAELVPTIFVKRAVPAVVGASAEQRPYTPLELEGRDIYIREGCYTCHSQMIRPLVAETQRYGAFSKPEEFIYDHPFQWGSKRTGPDLHRVGGKYPNVWHYTHLVDPRATSPGSNMPTYAWTKDWVVDVERTPRKLEVLKSIGVPYAAKEIAGAKAAYREQAERVVTELATQSVVVAWDKEIVALIAYLQRLGRQPVDGTKSVASGAEEKR